MEKIELFKTLLNKQIYESCRHRIVKEVFPALLQDFYEALEQAHSVTTQDISCKDIWYVYSTSNPTLSEAKREFAKSIMARVNTTEPLNPEILDYTLAKVMAELKATRIAQAALDIAHGKTEDFSIIQGILDDTSGNRDIELVTTDVAALTQEIAASYKWEFNLPELNSTIGKIGPGLIILAGPVNSGKSAMGISFTYAPGGFAEQGAKCVYVGNEENRKRMMLRAISCYTGMTRDQILQRPEQAQAMYDKIRDNTCMISNSVTAFSELTHIVSKLRPDVLIVDMLDKVQTPSLLKNDRHLQLGDIYARARDLADKYQCAVFGLSQTNGDTFGQLTIDQNQLAGSRVDKAANADLILTLGQLPSSDENNTFRRIHVAKTKSEGDKASINCQIQPLLSRIIP